MRIKPITRIYSLLYPIYCSTMLLDTLNLGCGKLGGTYQREPCVPAFMDYVDATCSSPIISGVFEMCDNPDLKRSTHNGV